MGSLLALAFGVLCLVVGFWVLVDRRLFATSRAGARQMGPRWEIGWNGSRIAAWQFSKALLRKTGYRIAKEDLEAGTLLGVSRRRFSMEASVLTLRFHEARGRVRVVVHSGPVDGLSRSDLAVKALAGFVSCWQAGVAQGDGSWSGYYRPEALP